MDAGKISSGTPVIDQLLGGYEKDVITTFYGPAGSGKTNFCLVALAHQLSQGNKVVFIDTEGSLSIERLLQVLPDARKYLDNLLFIKPTTFNEQKEAFVELQKAVDQQEISLIIIDSIAMLYRLEIGQSSDIYTVNRDLGVQLGQLTEIARKQSIPVLITNQVYADFETGGVKMVGGDLLKYSSKCLLELQQNGERSVVVKKHRALPEGKTSQFVIVESGIECLE